MNLRIIAWGMVGLGAIAATFWSWSQPGLLTTSSGTSVTGCDQPRNKNAAGVCPRLFCQKALRDHLEIGDRAKVSLEQSFSSPDGDESIHVGKAQWRENDKSEHRIVRCLMEGDTVVRSGPITVEELNRMVYGRERL
jgi:hypothetical protein